LLPVMKLLQQFRFRLKKWTTNYHWLNKTLWGPMPSHMWQVICWGNVCTSTIARCAPKSSVIRTNLTVPINFFVISKRMTTKKAYMVDLQSPQLVLFNM
jgi:hypothetical protein